MRMEPVNAVAPTGFIGTFISVVLPVVAAFVAGLFAKRTTKMNNEASPYAAISAENVALRAEVAATNMRLDALSSQLDIERAQWREERLALSRQIGDMAHHIAQMDMQAERVKHQAEQDRERAEYEVERLVRALTSLEVILDWIEAGCPPPPPEVPIAVKSVLRLYKEAKTTKDEG